jgi:hypothetical protein
MKITPGCTLYIVENNLSEPKERFYELFDDWENAAQFAYGNNLEHCVHVVTLATHEITRAIRMFECVAVKNPAREGETK